MMNTKTKYDTRYTVHFWTVDDDGHSHPDNIIAGNLTEALRLVRDMFPDAVLHGAHDGITATHEGGTLAIVTEVHTLPAHFYPSNPSPMEKDIEASIKRDERIKELVEDNNRMTAELEKVNARNEAHKRDIERAKLEMLDKGTLIEELLRWTAVAKREREHKDQAEEVMNGQQEVINSFADDITEIKRNARAEVDKVREEGLKGMAQMSTDVSKWRDAYKEARKQIEEQFATIKELRQWKWDIMDNVPKAMLETWVERAEAVRKLKE